MQSREKILPVLIRLGTQKYKRSGTHREAAGMDWGLQIRAI